METVAPELQKRGPGRPPGSGNHSHTQTEKMPISWVQFHRPDTRVSANAGNTGALVSGGSMSLFLQTIMGEVFVVAEDPTFSVPGRFPMSNVAAWG